MLQASNASKKCGGNITKNFSNVSASIKNGVVGFAKGAAKSLLALTVAAGVAFSAIGAQGLSYASDLTEVQNVVDKTFSTSAYIINDFADTALEAYGITKLEAKSFSGTMGAMLKSMGLSGDEVLVMSQNLTALSGDMASFYNLSATEAFDKIRAGISGETEPLKQLGINMSVANLEAYALSNGIKTQYSEMEQGDQALLRYNYLLEATKDAQGDFNDTSDSFANQQKLLKASLQETSGEIMQNMIPALSAGMQQLNGFLAGLDTAAIGGFVAELGNMAIAFLPMVMDLLPSFGSLLMMIVPPLMEIAQMLVPILVQVVGTLMEAIRPLLPIFMDIVKVLLPPIALILEAIMPLISGLASIIGGMLSNAITYLVKLLTPALELLKGVGDVIGKVGGAIGGFLSGKVAPLLGGATGKAATAQTQSLPAYACGGFANSPSIFGEAGLEAAIPIRPGSPHSIGLLQRTAQMLGIGEQYNNKNEHQTQFTYAPVINMTNPEAIEPVLKRQARAMRGMMDEYFARKERVAWG